MTCWGFCRDDSNGDLLNTATYNGVMEAYFDGEVSGTVSAHIYASLLGLLKFNTLTTIG